MKIKNSKIGQKQIDKDGNLYVMINGKKIYQIEETTPEKKRLNAYINRVRASGLRPSEYLNRNLKK